MRDVKIIPGDTTCLSLMSVLTPPPPPPPPQYHPPPPPTQPTPVAVGQEIWRRLMASLLKAAENVCRSTKKDGCWKETWWWNLAVDSAVVGKWRCWEIWNNGGCNEKYEKVKSLAKHTVYLSKSWAKSSRTLHPAALTYAASPTKWDAKTWMLQLVTGRPGLATAWKEHYECLSNVEFNWDPDFLTVLSLPHRRPGNPHTSWAGDQGHQYDEMWQGCWYTPDRSWNLESLSGWRGLAGPCSNRGYHPFQEEPYWMDAEYHRLSL